MNRKFDLLLIRGAIATLLTIIILTILLVACGETPTPTGQPLPTSTSPLLTLPLPQTPNNNLPTSTLGSGVLTGVASTATAAVFGGATASQSVDATATSVLPSVVAFSPGLPTDTVGGGNPPPVNPTTTVAVTNTTDAAGNTVTPNPAVPTPNAPPPTAPIGISPNPPPTATAPVGISPAVINNAASIVEQRFQLDLDGFKAEVSLEYPRVGAGPYPTVLMFQPYALYDLDATATTSRFGIGSRNYKVIADQLALGGFAVVRYTKRGYDPSGQPPVQDTTIDQLIKDAETAFNQVKTNPSVDPRKILLLGEDEGATVAMRLAQKQADNVAGLVLIAPVTNPRSAWHYQSVDAPLAYARQSLDHNQDGQLSAQEWSNAPAGTFLAGWQNVALNNGKITSLVSTNNSQSTDIERDLKPFLERTFQTGPAAYPDRAAYLSAWFNLGDNIQTLAGFKKPVLILQGALDQQVPLSQGADLDKFLAQQNNSAHTLITYPKLGHNLYKLDRGGADVLGPIDVNLEPPNNPLDDLLGWLSKYFS